MDWQRVETELSKAVPHSAGQVQVASTAPAEPIAPAGSPTPAEPAAALSYSSASRKRTGQGLAIVALCVGMALAAACIVIPQIDANRRLTYERSRLQADKQQIAEQISVNAEFLKKVADDPQLAERLAQRQMKMLRQGTSVLDLKEDWPRSTDMSPFMLVNVPPPAPLPPYQPMPGVLAKLCLNHRYQMDLLAASMFLAAAGLVLGGESDAA